MGGFKRSVGPKVHQAHKGFLAFDIATMYATEGIALIVMAGTEYGSGPSRDWAAKGTFLLGVKSVLAGSFERIHRSNLVAMGVSPLQFLAGESVQSWGLCDEETYYITGLTDIDAVPRTVTVRAERDGVDREFVMAVRINTPSESEYFRHAE